MSLVDITYTQILGKIICRIIQKYTAQKEGAQEAHEAIRPSDVNVLPKDLKNVEDDAAIVSAYMAIFCCESDAPSKISKHKYSCWLR